MSGEQKEIIEVFGDNEVREYAHTKVPKFLLGVYVILPIWGITWWLLFWDGSTGWFDRGYWNELESAAKTKLVVEEVSKPSEKAESARR